MIRAPHLLILALCCGLVACGGPLDDTPDGGLDGGVDAGDAGQDAGPPPTGDAVISGQVQVPLRGSSAPTASVAPQASSPAAYRGPAPLPGEEHVAGQVLVRLRGRGPEALREVSGAVPGLRLRARTWVAPDLALVELEDLEGRGPPDHARTLAARDVLARHPAVADCEPNQIRWPLMTPNDPLLSEQWALSQARISDAWDLTVGDPSLVLAIIDAGVSPHPDLEGRLLPGYDFVSDERLSRDGDGWDDDPSAVTVFHGIHVAGSAAATGNNGESIAGVDWQAQVLPVRVLNYHGTTADIVAGTRWAVGAEVPGAPTNPNPARVLNLSLGGGALSASEQAAVYEARERGAVVVVAAGNDNTDAGRTSMGGYQGVVVVGAVGPSGQRAPYSNYGEVVDLMAPGGFGGAYDGNGDGAGDGIVSLWLDGAGLPDIAYLQGTSMAAPHVAGVVSLMLAVNPALTPDEVEAILKETANPSAQCEEGCGAGLLDAEAAVAQAAADAVQPRLTCSETWIDFMGEEGGAVTLANAGAEPLQWEAISSDPHLVVGEPVGGTLEGRESVLLPLRVDRTGLADGVYEVTLSITSNGGDETVTVAWWVGPTPRQEVGAVTVTAYRLGTGSQEISVVTDEAHDFRYEIPVPPGDWLLRAEADPDGDGVSEWLGYRTLAIPARAGAQLEGQDVALRPEP